MPTVPPAPGRFSTTKLWLYLVENRFASSLAVRSSAPPGVKGTIILTGLLGQSEVWAKAFENENKTINGSKNIFFIGALP